MTTNHRISLFALSILVGIGCSNGPTENDCDVGESCPCASDTDCPNPILERCDAFRGICVARAGDVNGEDLPDDRDAVDARDTQPDEKVENPGACTEEPDLRIVSRQEGGVLPVCGESCIDDEDPMDCLASCFGELGLSPDCTDCHLDAARCVFEGCAAQCRPESGGQEDSPACQACVSGTCFTAFDECAGTWRTGVDECTDMRDRAVLQRTDLADLRDEAVRCVASCPADDQAVCPSDCLAAALEVGAYCGECFLRHEPCVEIVCELQCEDPDSEACVHCNANACLGELATCTGYPYSGDDPTLPDPDVVDAADATPDFGLESGTDTALPVEEHAWIGFIHLSPDTRALSLYVGTGAAVVASAPGFGQSSGLAAVPRTGEDISVLFSDTAPPTTPLLTLVPERVFGIDEVHTVVVFGESTGRPATFAGALRVEAEPDVDGGMSWSLFNASAVAGTVDVFNVAEPESPESLATGLVFGTASSRSIRGSLGAFTIGVDVGRDGSIDHTFTIGPFEADSHVTLWLANDASDELVLYGSTSRGAFFEGSVAE